jgi:hypothetical protein
MDSTLRKDMSMIPKRLLVFSAICLIFTAFPLIAEAGDWMAWTIERPINAAGAGTSGDLKDRDVMTPLERKDWLGEKILNHGWSKWTASQVLEVVEMGDEQSLADVKRREKDAAAANERYMKQNEEPQLKEEIAEFDIPVRHMHTSNYSKDFGHLILRRDGADFDGSEHPIRFSKQDVMYIDVRAGQALRFNLRDGTSWAFEMIRESDVATKHFSGYHSPSIFEDLVLAQWGFTRTPNGQRINPPAQANNIK